MVQLVVQSIHDREEAFEQIRRAPIPYTIEITKGAKRSVQQNRLQRLWINEGAEQLDGWAPEDLRAYCKLHYGVPILRNESASFKDQYDNVIRPLPYEMKLELMKVPIDFPVTRLMTTAQTTRYLDDMYHAITAMNAKLTEPERRQIS